MFQQGTRNLIKSKLLWPQYSLELDGWPGTVYAGKNYNNGNENGKSRNYDRLVSNYLQLRPVIVYGRFYRDYQLEVCCTA